MKNKKPLFIATIVTVLAIVIFLFNYDFYDRRGDFGKSKKDDFLNINKKLSSTVPSQGTYSYELPQTTIVEQTLSPIEIEQNIIESIRKGEIKEVEKKKE